MPWSGTQMPLSPVLLMEIPGWKTILELFLLVFGYVLTFFRMFLLVYIYLLMSLHACTVRPTQSGQSGLLWLQSQAKHVIII